ncbi:hypothetical protein CTAYLR_006798 [Chrysophaeum taylorii]|uniref:non-specific serine/threonine protein kinase n=1 Tax=Chrysophaeum taylorii TaxID=2483200 RepID=A0AAD7XID8_9STRA|nr:hypothetical protein CTAYLR_006798 [Chrysophaeum taylorii]
MRTALRAIENAATPTGSERPKRRSLGEGRPSHKKLKLNSGGNNNNKKKKRVEIDYATFIEQLDAATTLASAGGSSSSEEDSYERGGYHRVAVGDVFKRRYRVVSKLGWGTYSTVWRCWDQVADAPVALKIQRAESSFAAAAINEVVMLERVAEAAPNAPVVKLLDHFFFAGPNGNHVCLVLECLDETLLVACKRRNGLPIHQVKAITRALLDALRILHDDLGVVHGDLKPENLMLRAGSGPVGDRLRLVDFGLAFFADRQRGVDIQTREYRCPEGLLGIHDYSPAADIWSVGCLVFELVTGVFLFSVPSPKKYDGYAKDEAHLAQAVELLGPIPFSLASRRGAKAARWFSAGTATLNNVAPRIPTPGVDAMAHVLEDELGFPKTEAQGISTFLRPFLQFEPSRRITARDALKSDWLKL